MRLSKWRKSAPTSESMSDRVLATLKPVLVDLGDDADPECWVAWGDDPGRYSILAPTVAGLVTVGVRPGGAGEAPRANGKLTRWPKLAVSELSIESSDGHRLVAVQVESLVLKGVDEVADRICEFVRGLIASIDDRTAKPIHAVVAQGTPAKSAAAVRTVPAAAPRAAAPTKRAAGPTPSAAASPKPRSGSGRKVVPPATKPAGSIRSPKPAAMPAPTLSSSTAAVALPVPASVAASGTDAPNEKVLRALPSGKRVPIGSREAAPSLDAEGAAEPEPSKQEALEPEIDLPEWVSPHPIEELPAHEPARPRPWMP